MNFNLNKGDKMKDYLVGEVLMLYVVNAKNGDDALKIARKHHPKICGFKVWDKKHDRPLSKLMRLK